MTLRFDELFYKMTGSGNDFLFFDRSRLPAEEVERSPLASADRIRALCARGTGVGADGVVILHRSSAADFGILYFNSDGSRASLCGNASLCTTRLAAALGLGAAAGMTFETDAGVLSARLADGLPEIDLDPPSGVRTDLAIPLLSGERRIGFAKAGVPHVVVLVDDVAAVDLATRGKELRWHTDFAEGANANFVARGPEGWCIRTFERGVEGETLACGTGAVATAVLLEGWGECGRTTTLRTASGQPLTVRTAAGQPRVSLRGEGRLVFRGELPADRGD